MTVSKGPWPLVQTKSVPVWAKIKYHQTNCPAKFCLKNTTLKWKMLQLFNKNLILAFILCAKIHKKPQIIHHSSFPHCFFILFSCGCHILIFIITCHDLLKFSPRERTQLAECLQLAWLLDFYSAYWLVLNIDDNQSTPLYFWFCLSDKLILLNFLPF